MRRRQASPSRVCRVVALASRTGRYGGPYDTARRQALLAASLGADAILLAASLPDDTPTITAADGFSYRFLPAKEVWEQRFWSLLPSYRMVRALWREIGCAQLVHISFAREPIPLIAALMCAIRRTAWIAQPHGMLTSRRSTMHVAADLLLVPLLRTADLILGLTDREVADLKALGGIRNSRFAAVGNPLPENLLEQDHSENGDGSPREVLFIARLHPRKRVDDFIAAASVANDRSWQGCYRVVGPDGGDADKVVDAARRLPNLTFEGAVSADGVVDCLRNASSFVLCSENEPWGNVLVTALALGVPVVVARSAALSGEIENAGAGIVVPDGDAVAIANAVNRILSQPDSTAAMSSNARDFAQRVLSDESQRKTIEAMYRDLGWTPARG